MLSSTTASTQFPHGVILQQLVLFVKLKWLRTMPRDVQLMRCVERVSHVLSRCHGGKSSNLTGHVSIYEWGHAIKPFLQAIDVFGMPCRLPLFIYHLRWVSVLVSVTDLSLE